MGDGLAMKSKSMLPIAIMAAVLARLAAAQNKYTVKVPNGPAFSEFKGYEAWQLVSISRNGPRVAAILANPVMIKAYQEGIPFPDLCKMAKVHWTPTKMDLFPTAAVPGAQYDVDFMEKDSKRFVDSGRWGYGAFEYGAASKTFRPVTTADQPPQGNNESCGFTCHTIAKTRDYVFTAYAHK
jgi:hypothetical protein